MVYGLGLLRKHQQALQNVLIPASVNAANRVSFVVARNRVSFVETDVHLPGSVHCQTFNSYPAATVADCQNLAIILRSFHDTIGMIIPYVNRPVC